MPKVYTYRLTTIVRFGDYKDQGLTLQQIMDKDFAWVKKQYKYNPGFKMDAIAQTEFLERVKDMRGLRTEYKGRGQNKRYRR